MSASDIYLKKMLTDPEFLEKEIEILNETFKPLVKKYNTVVFESLPRGKTSYGVIMKHQQEFLAIFENKNPQLGRFVGQNSIIERNNAIRIKYYDPAQSRVQVHRSLGKCLLFADGQSLEGSDEAHHIKHSAINTYNTVEAVSKSFNAGTRPELKTMVEVENYIRTELLQTDDHGYATFMHNIRFLAKRFKRNRGIFVNGMDPTETWLHDENIRHIEIELSKQ